MTDLDIQYTNRGVLIEGDLFISGDYHIGYSDSINGMTMDDEKTEIADRVTSVLEESDPSKFVINGDLFHEFNPASQEAREMYRDMVARISVDSEYLATIGNHDVPTNEKYPDLVDFESYRKFEYDTDSGTESVVVTHGHVEVDCEADLYVVGHLHPVIKINGIEWPLYLKGSNIYRDADVIILPTFTKYQDGAVVSDQMKLSIDFPIVARDRFKDMIPLVYDESGSTVREFPKLSESGDYFGV